MFLNKSDLIRKIRLISKFKTLFITSEPGSQKISMYILINISGGKGNRTMKFGQLMEYNMRNIFLKKLYTKCAGETIPRPFSKNQMEHFYGSVA